MRAASYCRVRLGEADANASLAAQQDAIDARVWSRPGSRLATAYLDCTLGSERPSLDVALADAAAGRFDVLVVHRLDRLTRSLTHLASILDALDRCGVALVSASDPWDSATVSSATAARALAVLADLEAMVVAAQVTLAAERVVRQAAADARRNGGWPGDGMSWRADDSGVGRYDWPGRTDAPTCDNGED